MLQKTVHIQANRPEKHYWLDIWHFKDLLYILAKRDVMVRYKQTFIGAAWGFVRPFFTLIGFAFIFTKITKQNGVDNVPYPVMAFAGILIWQFFSNTFLQISNVFLANSTLISKVYFPRLIMPLSAIFVVLVDFVMALILYIIIMLYFKSFPEWRVILLPLSLLHGFFLAFGIGLIFATLNVKYRDFGQLGPFLVQFGMFICPVAFRNNANNLSPTLAKIYNLNPIVGLIDSFRWMILPGNDSFPWHSFLPSIIFTILLLIISLYYFRKKEDRFVDYI